MNLRTKAGLGKVNLGEFSEIQEENHDLGPNCQCLKIINSSLNLNIITPLVV